ncbi:hypothetical protein BLOT_000729 [Blomia tropicalis]|nr:hypothetical protein BLOT_000729 [Blomia tropicalis]
MSKRRKRRNQMLTMFMMDKRYNVLYRLSLIIILNISIIVFIDCNLLRDFSMASPPVAEQSSRKCNQPASGIRGGMGGGSGGGGGGGHHDQSNDHGGHGGGHGHSRHHSRTHNNNTNSNSNGGGDHRPNSGTQSWPGHSLSSNSSWNSLKNRHGNSNNHVGKGSNNNHGNSNSHNDEDEEQDEDEDHEDEDYGGGGGGGGSGGYGGYGGFGNGRHMVIMNMTIQMDMAHQHQTIEIQTPTTQRNGKHLVNTRRFKFIVCDLLSSSSLENDNVNVLVSPSP